MIGYSILCLQIKDDLDSASMMVYLLVRFRYLFVYAADCVDLYDTLLDTRSKVVYHIVKCLKEFTELVEIDRNVILTRAFKSIANISEEILSWSKIEGTWCYEAIGTYDSFYYSINILDGYCLINGFPPGRLPKDILKNNLYVRSFGDRDFEVVNFDGILRTGLFDAHFYYEFGVDENKQIIIREVDSRSGDIFELSQFGTDIEWENVPRRLVEKYSHWVCFEKNLVLFRNKIFNERTVEAFGSVQQNQMVIFNEQSTFDSIWEVYYFNTKKFELFSERSIFSSNVFVCLSLNSDILNILKEFENSEFIEQLNSNKGILFKLPRFGLSFIIHKGRVESLEYRDYFLSENQQFNSMLPFFKHYLLLENDYGSLKMIVPDGDLSLKEGGCRIELSGDLFAKIGTFTYNFHECLNLFVSNSILSRLHPASIFAFAGNLMPDAFLKMTGAEAALSMVRQCWISRPFSMLEFSKLRNIAQYSGKLASLSCLCYKLLEHSQKLDFLYSNDKPKYQQEFQFQYGNDSLSRIRNELKNIEITNVHGSLKADEISSMFGSNFSDKKLFTAVINTEIKKFPCNIDADFVKNIEISLHSFLAEVQKSSSHPSFPISKGDDDSFAGKTMINDLIESWNLHHSERELDLKSTFILNDFAKARLSDILAKIKCLMNVLNTFNSFENSEFNLLKISNRYPAPTVSDLLRIACSPVLVKRFNPILSEIAIKEYHRAVLTLLELFVMKDKLSRILNYIASGTESNSKLIQELNVRRIWSVEEHPYWLVFEAENSLQIRPEQFQVASHLISNPGSISQLNMGLG